MFFFRRLFSCYENGGNNLEMTVTLFSIGMILFIYG